MWMAVIATVFCAASCVAQSAGKPAVAPLRPIEVALDFNYVHSNAPVAGCGCFPLLGGSVSGAYYYGPQFALVAEFSKTNNDNVDATTHELTISNYLFGGKFLFPREKKRFTPYVQTLVGLARDSGTIAQVYPGGASTFDVFAATVGGGVDYRIKDKFTFRVAKVEYYVTTFPNRADNHQNNLRVTSGIALRF
jgi:outer membrane immunogenic protein